MSKTIILQDFYLEPIKNKRILRKMNQFSNKRMKLKVYKNPKNVGISGSADVTCPQTNYTHRCYQTIS